MNHARPLFLLLLNAALLTGCALLPKPHPSPTLRAVAAPLAQPGARPADGLYEDAVRAINHREYAAALDRLQAATQRDPNDARVLNAVGVVYDKLGRFDLSARYYALAAAADPGSEIVRQNLAYSALLQKETRGQAAPVLATLTPQFPAAGSISLAASPIVRIQLARATEQSAPVLARGVTGRPLQLVNATGRRDLEGVRLQLAQLGWSTPRSAERGATMQPLTQIIYARNATVAAQALARTLPEKVALRVCADQCAGVQLILGSDSLGWKHRIGHSLIRRI